MGVFGPCLSRLGAYSSVDIASLHGITVDELSRFGNRECRKLRLAQKKRLVHLLNGGLPPMVPPPAAPPTTLSAMLGLGGTPTPAPTAEAVDHSEDDHEELRDELRKIRQ